MILQFVNDTAVGPKERRLIRSHVMKGKNAGKPRPARARLIHRDCQTPKKSPHDDKQELMIHTKPVIPLNRLFWNDLSLTTYPSPIDSSTHDFVYSRLWLITKTLYPPTFCLPIDLSTYPWLQYILSDAAHFHTILALSTSLSLPSPHPQHPTFSSLRHISHAYHLTNAHLSSPTPCSNEAIAAVTMLAIYQRVHQQQDTGLVHFGGLKRMIELRGGLGRLRAENRGLGGKPWRVGLEFAVQGGERVGFRLGEILDVEELARIGEEEHITDVGVEIEMGLKRLFKRVKGLVEKLDDIATGKRDRMDPLDYSDEVCVRLHGLLDYAPLGTEHRAHLGPLEDLVHLTLVAIMTTLMPEYGYGQARYDLLAGQLRNAIRKYSLVENRIQDLLIWAVFVGYATVLKCVDEAILPSLVSELGAQSWSGIRNRLCQYGWISVLYDKAGMELESMINHQRGIGSY